MKTITKKINLYDYNELSKEAKERALNDFRNGNEYDSLSDFMNEHLHELLEDNKIKDTNDTSKPNTKPTPVLYCLSHSQGGGAMFEGVFEWKKYQVIIKHSGRYFHSNSKTIEITFGDDIANEVDDKIYIAFEKIYQKICKELENYGYDFIETEDSEQNFIESCESNDWTFTEDGEMFNN